MKKPFLVILTLLLLGSHAFGQKNQMKAFIDYKSYYSPEQGPYIDLQFQFVAYTIKFIPVDSVLQAKIAVRTIVTSEPSGDTVYSNAFALESPRMRDSIVEDFFDNIRIPLQPGNYTAHLTLADLNNGKDKTLEGQIELVVPQKFAQVALSDILVAEVASPSSNTESSFYKSGYEIIPRISNFYGQTMLNIPYYIELYNTTQIPDSSFGFRQQIISTQTNQAVPGFTRFTKIKASPVVPIMRNVDISKLPSGSYQLKLEIIDRNSKTIGQAVDYFFERINDIEVAGDVEEIILDPNFQASITDDSLQYYLASLIPIARPAEVKSIMKTLKAKSPNLARKHIQQFWIQTSGANATNAWLTYKKNVMLVQQNYGNNFQDGFETDRGRVFLQYGQPNTIIVRETSPSEYPYEIWHYYKIKTFSNKRFVFYNPDLVNNGYRLLHSDMVGEQQNYKWQEMLVRRNASNMNVDSNSGNNQYGTNSGYYYKQD
jgi:GWxTD domain-containing protein